MGVLAVGDIIAVEFPFTVGPKLKKRPGIVVATLPLDDVIVSYITSRDQPGAVRLPADAVRDGRLPLDSFIRPEKLLTVGSSVAQYLGKAAPDITNEVLARLRELFTPR